MCLLFSKPNFTPIKLLACEKFIYLYHIQFIVYRVKGRADQCVVCF